MFHVKHRHERGEVIRELTDADFHQSVDESRIPCLVAFWAIWSPSCMELSKTLEKVDKKYSTSVLIGKVNVDNEIKTANEFEVQNIPTIIIFRGGKEQFRIPGAVTYQYLSKKLELGDPRKKTKDAKKKGENHE
jgi:thioredoxin 1